VTAREDSEGRAASTSPRGLRRISRSRPAMQAPERPKIMDLTTGKYYEPAKSQLPQRQEGTRWWEITICAHPNHGERFARRMNPRSSSLPAARRISTRSSRLGGFVADKPSAVLRMSFQQVLHRVARYRLREKARTTVRAPSNAPSPLELVIGRPAARVIGDSTYVAVRVTV